MLTLREGFGYSSGGVLGFVGWNLCGYGTPLVVGGNVYVFTRVAGRETLTALRADSGEILWRSGYDAAYDPATPAAKHGRPKATPVMPAQDPRSASAAP